MLPYLRSLGPRAPQKQAGVGVKDTTILARSLASPPGAEDTCHLPLGVGVQRRLCAWRLPARATKQRLPHTYIPSSGADALRGE